MPSVSESYAAWAASRWSIYADGPERRAFVAAARAAMPWLYGHAV